MKLQVLPVAVSVLLWGRADAAFVTKSSVGSSTASITHATPFIQSSRPSSSSLQQSLQPEQFTDALSSMLTTTTTSSSMWLATVDSDIAKLSDNEFAPIFLGGVMVMVGGVISALIVGLILEKRDLYANVVADLYAQGNPEDEAFWKGLSDEEKKKTQEALQRLRQSKEGTTPSVPSVAAAAAASSVAEPESAAVAAPAPRAVVETGASSQSAQKLDMFSDYADS